MTDDLTRSLRTAYDRRAAERDQSGKEPWKLEQRAQFAALLRHEHKQTLLEIGAGPGHDAAYFRDQGLDTVCIDLSPEHVRLCRRKGLTAEVMDVGALRFAPASFDAVCTLNSLLHVPNQALPEVLRTIDSILRPNGVCYLGVYGGPDREGILPDDSYDPPRFFAFYSDAQLQAVVREVFEVHSFTCIELGTSKDLHFQACILRKKAPAGKLPAPPG